MAKATVYSIVLAPELRDAFLAAAAACERPPAQVLRGLMREFIQQQQDAGTEDAGDESSGESDGIATENITDVTDTPDIVDAAAEASPPTEGITETKAAASEAVA
jgi:hypothetical protein